VNPGAQKEKHLLRCFTISSRRVTRVKNPLISHI